MSYFRAPKCDRLGLALFGFLFLSLSACGDDDKTAAGRSAVLVAVQPSDAVAASAGAYSITVLNSGGEEIAKASVASVTSATTIPLAAGTYTVSASAYAAGDTGTAIASTSGSVTVKRGKTGAVVLALRLADGPVVTSITASNAAPQNQDLITLKALLSNSPATGGTFAWEDNCRGEFVDAAGSEVVWSNNWAEDCKITVTATRDDGTSSVTLPLTTTYKKGTIVPVAGAYCSIFAGDTTWYDTVAVAPLFGEGGPAVDAGMSHVYGMDIGPDGNLYMAEREAGRISMVDMATGNIHRIMGTFEGSITEAAVSGLPATSPAMYWVTDVKVFQDGSLLAASFWSERVWKYYPNDLTMGIFAGTGGSSVATNGALAHQTSVYHPIALAIAGNGDVFVASQNHDRIYRIYASGHTVTTFATGVGTGGDMGHGPFDLEIDSNGKLIVASRFTHEIYRYSMDGSRTVIAGTGILGNGGMQGPVTQTAISHPFGVAAGASGKVYFTDSFNHKIRVAGQGGNVKTLVGPGLNPIAGSPGFADRPIEFPTDVEVDAAGNLYVSQKERCEVVKVVGPY